MTTKVLINDEEVENIHPTNLRFFLALKLKDQYIGRRQSGLVTKVTHKEEGDNVTVEITLDGATVSGNSPYKHKNRTLRHRGPNAPITEVTFYGSNNDTHYVDEPEIGKLIKLSAGENFKIKCVDEKEKEVTLIGQIIEQIFEYEFAGSSSLWTAVH